MFSNYHTHTTFCDGKDSPEELVLEALRLGCPEIGFSGHSHLAEDVGSMSEQGTLEYCAEVRRLQKEYEDRIRILLGIEQDIFSDIDRSLFDYVIGAVHYVEKDGKKLAVDESREGFLSAVEEAYGGDFYAIAEEYYALVGALPEKTGCDVIAHFDLITKYNEADTLFSTADPRYLAAADAALVLRALVGYETLAGTGLANARVCGGKTLSAEDAAAILRYVVRLIDRFPAEE